MSSASPGCGCCGSSIRSEYGYMLHKEVWQGAIRRGQHHGLPVSRKHLLCIGCVEACLGRQLTRADFNWDIPLNTLPDYKRSPRLLNRMNKETP